MLVCFLSFILLTRYIELVSLGRTLHSRDKSHVVMVHDAMLLNMLAAVCAKVLICSFLVTSLPGFITVMLASQ